MKGNLRGGLAWTSAISKAGGVGRGLPVGLGEHRAGEKGGENQTGERSHHHSNLW